MDFPFLCHACHAPTPQPYRDDGQYQWACSCGAKNAATLRNERFEVLFDFGALAYLDGYYREAVANFATAYERLLGFFVRVVWTHIGLPAEQAEAAWKPLSKHSERQLGAFVAAHLQACGTVPEMPGNRDIEFRNNVVHKGMIPDRRQTEQYATSLYRMMKAHLTALNASAGEAVIAHIEAPSREHGKRAALEGRAFAVYCYDGLFGVYRFLPFVMGLENERAAWGDRRIAEMLSIQLDSPEALRVVPSSS